MIDWHYPWMWQIDLDSYYRSIWLGWWLITWCQDDPWRSIRVAFQPGWVIERREALQ